MRVFDGIRWAVFAIVVAITLCASSVAEAKFTSVLAPTAVNIALVGGAASSVPAATAASEFRVGQILPCDLVEPLRDLSMDDLLRKTTGNVTDGAIERYATSEEYWLQAKSARVGKGSEAFHSFNENLRHRASKSGLVDLPTAALDRPQAAADRLILRKLPSGDYEIVELLQQKSSASGKSHLSTVDGALEILRSYPDDVIHVPANREQIDALEEEIRRCKLLGKNPRGVQEVENALRTGRIRSTNPSGAPLPKYDEYEKPIKSWTEREFAAKKAERAAAERVRAVKPLTGGKFTSLESAPRAVTGYRQTVRSSIEQIEARPGVLTRSGKLIVTQPGEAVAEGAGGVRVVRGVGRVGGAAVAGLSAGGVSLVIDLASATWSYADGTMTSDEFVAELGHSAIRGTAVGGSTAVVVLLGATPTGWIVVGVGVGAYVITDLVIELSTQADLQLTTQDLEDFGIVVRTPMLTPETLPTPLRTPERLPTPLRTPENLPSPLDPKRGK